MIARAALAIRLRYLAAGLVLGLIWAWHADEPPWEHVLRLVIVVLILAPVLRLAPRIRGVRRAGARRLSWTWLLAFKLPLIGLAALADWALGHWMTATASGIVTGVALAATVATLGPVLHPRLFAAAPRAGSDIGVRAQAGGLAAGDREQAARPARPGPRSRRRIAARLGGAALVLMAGFLLKHFITHWILRHGLTGRGFAVEGVAAAIVVALGITAWVRRRRSAAGHAGAHINEADTNNSGFTEEADHAATQRIADHVRPAPGRRDGVRRRPGGADPAH